MKKSSFGMMLFLVGVIGYLILSLYLSMHMVTYNGMTGTVAALISNELTIPYAVFCIMGICGLCICAYYTFFHK